MARGRRRAMAASVRQRALGAVLAASAASVANGLYDQVRRIESARLYGNIGGYQYYFTDITVGTPPQRVSVILDSGSGLLAFPCAGCAHCGKHIDPLFDVAKSSTAKWIKCGRDCNGQCRSNHCGYSQSYLEGSSISGYWFEDYVRIGDNIQHNPPVSARMGCHQNENKLFYTQKANGIFGIQGSKTLIRDLFKDREHVDGSVFSICLSVEGGRFTVGGYNDTLLLGEVQYVKQVSTNYRVRMTSITLNGKQVTGFPTTIIDSGTTYTYFAGSHYRALRSALESACSGGKCGGARLHGTCWSGPKTAEDLQSFPSMDFMFGSVHVVWRPQEYLYKKGTSWCYAFENDGATSTTTLGASWMLYKQVVFDLGQSRIGFSPAACPQYSVRPQHTTEGASSFWPSASSSSPSAAGAAASDDESAAGGSAKLIAAVFGVLSCCLVSCYVVRRRVRSRHGGTHRHVEMAEEEGLEEGVPGDVIGTAADDDDETVVGRA